MTVIVTMLCGTLGRHALCSGVIHGGSPCGCQCHHPNPTGLGLE